MSAELPNTAFVILPGGAFGGAEKRFTNLFLYLSNKYPGKFHFIINPLMKQHTERVFGNISSPYVHLIDKIDNNITAKEKSGADTPAQYNDIIPDPFVVDKNTSVFRKYYWFYKNKNKQKKLFEEIDEIRKKENIKVFIGVFAGGLPLAFYIEQQVKDVKIVFSDMDSWFSDVLSDTKKLWYRKYYSFNFILENACKVDFLSPFIAEGVKKLGVNIPSERISVAPCSFIDYSKCRVGEKNNFEIAFASRLEPDKKPMLFLEAAREILKEFPGTRFHLLGEGSLVNEIRNYISENGLEENISFRFHNNPPEIFSSTSVFVSLQTGTNYPSQSVLEAMASGNAIVASNTGDTSLFVNSSNGILVELNKDSVTAALRKLITNPDETKAMGLNAAKFAIENHTINRASDYYINLIKSTAETAYK